MVMPQGFIAPRGAKISKFIGRASSALANIGDQVYIKDPASSMMFFLLGGGGGPGGNGNVGNAGTQRSGGGGGASGSIGTLLISSIFVPTEIRMKIATAQDKASGVGGGNTELYVPNYTAQTTTTLWTVAGGGAGANGSTVTGGAGGTPGGSPTFSNWTLCGVRTSVDGNAGGQGGSSGAVGNQNASPSSLFLGGSGGGSLSAGNQAFAGGSTLTHPYLYTATAAGALVSTDGMGGGNAIERLGDMWRFIPGGGGGGGAAQGGRGGDGGPCCGGGGGGATLTGTTAIGGNGGAGIVIVVEW